MYRGGKLQRDFGPMIDSTMRIANLMTFYNILEYQEILESTYSKPEGTIKCEDAKKQIRWHQQQL